MEDPVVRARLDRARLAAVRATGLLDTPPEEAFDRLTRLAVALVGAPVAFVSLVDEFRDFYKSHCGFGEPLATVRQLEGTTFCHYAIAREEPLVIPDTRADPVFREVPTVESLGVAAYVGIPIHTAQGVVLGSFCAIDFEPREWTGRDVEVLSELARSAEREIQLREALRAFEARAQEADISAEQLRESEERFRTALEHAPIGMALVDLDGRWIQVNRALCEITGHREEELLGTTFQDVTHPDDLDEDLRQARRLRSGEVSSYELEKRYVRKDGSAVWVLLTGSVVRHPDGSPLYYIAQVQNIDERRRAAEALRLSEQRLTFALEGASEGMWDWDVATGGVYFSPRWCEMIGCDPDTVAPVFDFWEQRVCPDDLPETLARIRAHLDGQTPTYEAEFRMRHRAGHWVWVLSRGKVMERDPQGRPVRVVGTHADVTARKAAEEELRASEERFRLLVESVRDYAIFMLDPAGHVTSWNRGAERIKGYTADEVLGRHFSLFFVEEDRRQGRPERDLAVAAAEGTCLDEGWRVSKDGRRYWATEAITAVHDGGGRLIGFAKVTRDLTERRRTEEALRLRDRAIAATPGGILITDACRPDNPVIHASPGFERLTGYPAEEVVGRNCRFLQGPDTDPTTVARVREAIEHATPITVELLNYRRDGSPFWNSLSISPVRDEGGTLTHFVGIQQDVTERKRAAEALEQSEHNHRFLAEAGAVLSSSIDYEDSLQRVAQFTVAALADLCIVDVVDGDQVWRFQAVRGQTQQGGPVKEPMDRLLSAEAGEPMAQAIRSGGTVHVSTVADSWLESAALSPGSLDSIRRLSPREVLLVPLRTGERYHGTLSLVLTTEGQCFGPGEIWLAEELGRRIGLAVEHARLYREAQAALRDRDEVLAVVAHDLRDPVATISTSASLLLDLPLPEPQRVQQLGIIKRTADRANRLIQDLLDVGRIQAGRLSISPAPVSVAAVADDLCEGAASRAEAVGQHFSCAVTEGLPAVLADRDRLIQALTNLIGNALKFTPEGGYVELRAESEGDAVRFSVSDTGPGIPAEHLPHLFTRFWQAQRTDRRGAGLGLTIVRGIVEAHGGHIDVSSVPGSGSTFSFTVPVAGDLEERDG